MRNLLKSPNLYAVIFMLSTLAFFSCDSSKVYEDFTDFEEAFWHQDSVAQFKFTIEDASIPYNLKAHFRNSQAYPYHNMYYQYTLKDGQDSVLAEQMKQIFLFDAKTGEPQGSGIGDLFDNTQTVLENYTFEGPGEYTAELKQYMRLDSLKFILSVGWRVEVVED